MSLFSSSLGTEEGETASVFEPAASMPSAISFSKMTKVWGDSGKESLLLTFRGYHLSLNSKELGVKFREEGGKNDGRGGDQSSLVAQWLRLHTSRAQGTGSIPGQGTKISQVHDSAREREREEAEGETESSEALIKNEGVPRAGVRVLLGPLVLVSSHPFILYFLFFLTHVSACYVPAVVLVLSRALFISSLMQQWRRCRLCSKTFCEAL